MPAPGTMRCAVVEAHGQPLTLKEVPVPEPGRNDVLVKLECCGICHTDIHVQDGDWSVRPSLPIIPGHEGVGVVAKLGADVVGLEEGDRVCIPMLTHACGRCEQCWAGWETVCDKATDIGYGMDGCFAEYVKANADFVARVPAGLTSEQCAPISCAGVTAYKGLKVTEVKPGQWVVIVGAAGGLGHMAVQYAKAMGMLVVALDSGDAKATFLKSLGADIVIDVKKGDIQQRILEATGGGAHGVMIMAGIRTAVQDAVQYCRPRAVIVQIAILDGDMPVNIEGLVGKCISIRGSAIGTRLDLKEALEWAAAGMVRCNVDVRKFSEVNQLMEELRSGKVNGRLVMDMSQ